MDAAAADARVAPAPAPPLSLHWAGLVWLAVLGGIACVLASVWLNAVPFGLAGALFAGGLVGVSVRTPREGLFTGAAAGVLGGALTIPYADSGLVAERLAHLPAYATADLASSWLHAYIVPVTAYHVVNIYFSDTLGHLAYPLFVGVATGLLALAAAALAGAGRTDAGPTDAERGDVARRRTAAVAVLAVLLCLVFAASAWSGGERFRDLSVTEPTVGGYSYDPVIFLRTYYVMGRGVDYYHALVTAAAGDSRLIATGAVRDGRFVGWATSPAFIRLPTAFWLWRLVPGGTTGVIALSVALCALLLGGMALAFVPLLGPRGLFVPLFAFPLLLGGTVLVNIFTPDWWAALALLGSVLVLLRGRFAAAGLLALAAALFRETATMWLLVLFLGAAWFRVWGEREWGRRAALYAGLLAVFGVAWTLHYRAGAPLIAAVHEQRSVADILRESAARPFVQRFEQPAAYMMLAYGFYAVPMSLLLVLQLGGFFGALRERTHERALVLAFALAWIAFTATVGATSSYWGQLYMPTALMGSAALLARPDLFVAAFRRGPVPAGAPVAGEGA